jgi:hypothetical protein
LAKGKSILVSPRFTFSQILGIMLQFDNIINVVENMLNRSLLADALHKRWGRAIAQAVNHQLPTRRPGLEPRSGNAGFVVDKVALAPNQQEEN